ncbi:MAG: peptide chain release factor N(5)-glutamine methyltransferase, partial [Prevotella sp.]|nr:peptide chain release factor N(5)-glutamine methyltransferase [Prevotella sp.]
MEGFSYQQLWQQLVPLYEAGEARALIRMLMETRFGINLSDLLCYGTSQLDEEQHEQLSKMISRLQTSEPIQYVLGEAQFYSRTFHVSPGVLIPRPETEVLCRWIVESAVLTPTQSSPEEMAKTFRILDIGCGSGCIAITLALEIKGAQVTAWDISPKALEVTRLNADSLGAHIIAEHCDILATTKKPGKSGKSGKPGKSGNSGNSGISASPQKPGITAPYDIIVSNPPYICRHEAGDIHPNVLRHEPHEALFVPDTDPLCFYDAIARYAADHLHPAGLLFFECNAAYPEEVACLLTEKGFRDVSTHDDDFGKTRFVRAHAIPQN